jgi:hypothetical protein
VSDLSALARAKSASALCYHARVPARRALRANSDLAPPGWRKISTPVSLRRWVVGGLSGLVVGGLVAFHLVLFAGRIADASIAHPEVLAKWLGALLLAAGALAHRRQGGALLSGRSGLVFWLLVLLLHVGFGNGLTPIGEAGGSSRDLVLLLPFAGFAALAASRGRRKPLQPRWTSPAGTFRPSLRFPPVEPLPALSSAGAGPARFSPRPPPLS